MRRELAVVICNYNKKDYVLKCIESLLQSTYKNLDIYVIDNASTDNSADAIKEKFQGALTLIVNNENLGGSGGFNTGLREVLKKDYKYVLLLDNDVILEKDAILELYRLLEENNDIAVSGSKLYSMDNPSQIQELGADIDFSEFYIKPFFKGYIDDGTLPEIVDCDYVPACSMMVRVDAIKKVGIMDEGNFIYWDDIDWGYRFKLKGYRVVTYSKSIVWHKMGVAQKTNTFGTYYFWRNRVNFFISHTKKEDLESFALKLFNEMFQAIYSCNYIGKYSSAKTISMAVDDALNGVRGKALENRIFDLEKVKDKFSNIIKDKKNILIINKSELKALRDVTNNIKCIDKNININIAVDNVEGLDNQFKDINILNLSSINDFHKYDIILKTCYHIFDIRNNIDDGIIYIDRFFNTIIDNEDRDYIKNYDNTYDMLKNVWYPVLLNKILELKNTIKD